MKNKKESTIAIAIAFALWQIISILIGEELFLPSPIGVLSKLIELIQTEAFFKIIYVSTMKISMGFFLSVSVGLLSAIISVYSKTVKILLKPYFSVLKSIPVASFVLLCLLWVKAENLSVFIAFAVVLPIIYINSLNGMISADNKLLEVAQVYKMSFSKKLFYIYFPEMKAHFLSAVSLASGVAWKSGVAAEVIGLPAFGIGNALQSAKIYLETGELFAWTVVILMLSTIFEKFTTVLFSTLFRRLER